MKREHRNSFIETFIHTRETPTNTLSLDRCPTETAKKQTFALRGFGPAVSVEIAIAKQYGKISAFVLFNQ